MSGEASTPNAESQRAPDLHGQNTAHYVTGYAALTPEQDRARKRRNLILGLSVAAFMVLVFVITIVRLKAGILDRPL